METFLYRLTQIHMEKPLLHQTEIQQLIPNASLCKFFCNTVFICLFVCLEFNGTFSTN